MASRTIPDEIHSREVKQVNTATAKKERWCHLCKKLYPAGSEIAFIRWSADSEDWGTAHPECFSSFSSFDGTLKEWRAGVTMPAQNGQPEVIPGQMVMAYVTKLPDGSRHRGERYATMAADKVLYVSGNKIKCVGVSEYINGEGGSRD